jgi:hypothetical protein
MNIDKKYRSYYYEFRNQTLNWLPSDTEETYNKNYETRYHELKKYGWVDNHFTYKFNSHGFRCEEFSDEPTLMALGCSNTVGIGLPVDKIWPELLAKELNMKCANLGIGGGSLDTTFKLCHGYIDIVKPKIVVLLEPSAERIEIFIDNFTYNPFMLGAWSIDTPDDAFHLSRYIKNFAKLWMVNKNNYYFNRKKNILGIKQMCKERNIKFVHQSYKYLGDSDSLARDLMHEGIANHIELAKNFLSKI